MNLSPDQRIYLLEEGFTESDGLWKRVVGTATEYIDLTGDVPCTYGYNNNQYGKRVRNQGPMLILRRISIVNKAQKSLDVFE